METLHHREDRFFGESRTIAQLLSITKHSSLVFAGMFFGGLQSVMFKELEKGIRRTNTDSSLNYKTQTSQKACDCHQEYHLYFHIFSPDKI